jgi:hypothetical protein
MLRFNLLPTNLIYKPWTFWKGTQSFCFCGKKTCTKPAPNCTEKRHLTCYVKNATDTKRRRAEAQLQAFIHYSGFDPPRCILCNYNNILALQLDHINGDGASFRRQNKYATGKSLCLFLRKREWPEGYRVLCANCQCLERERLGFNGSKKPTKLDS